MIEDKLRVQTKSSPRLQVNYYLRNSFVDG